MKKKFLSVILSCIIACSMFVMPAAAAEMTPANDTTATAIEIMPMAAGSFSGSTVKLNALNGGASVQSPISSGSVVGTKVSAVSLTATVSSGSSTSTIYVKNPAGLTVSRALGTSNTTFNYTEFNNSDPYGTWYVWIVTNGLVTTVTGNLKVTYA